MRAAERYPAITSSEPLASMLAAGPWPARAWDCFLRLLLVLWIVRVPLTLTLLGLAYLLGLTPQAQDLFMEFARTGWLWMLWFLVVLIVVWAMPTHYAARLLIDTDRRFRLSLARTPDGGERCSQVSALWVPRGYGVLNLCGRAVRHRPLMAQSARSPRPGRHGVCPLGADRHGTVGGGRWCGLFRVYAVAPTYRRNTSFSPAEAGQPGACAPVAHSLAGIAGGAGLDDEISRDAGRLLLLVLFAGFVLAFLAGAENVARVFSRAMAVPFILGGWLPFLAYLSGLGRACRAPLIILFFVLIAAASFFFGDTP